MYYYNKFCQMAISKFDAIVLWPLVAIGEYNWKISFLGGQSNNILHTCAEILFRIH